MKFCEREVLFIKRLLTYFFIFFLLSFLINTVSAAKTTEVLKTKKIELSPITSKEILPKGNIGNQNILKTSVSITAPELKERKLYYSNSIRVLVTKKDKEKIEHKILNLDEEIKMLAQVVYNEARGVNSITQQAAVIWCVLNRVDSSEFDNSINKVIKYPNAFAWKQDTVVEKQFIKLAEDVLIRWLLEKEGYLETGRVLPAEWVYFHSGQGKNNFKQESNSTRYWNWSLVSPYSN